MNEVTRDIRQSFGGNGGWHRRALSLVLSIGLVAGLLIIGLGEMSTSPIRLARTEISPEGAAARGLDARSQPLTPSRPGIHANADGGEGGPPSDVLGRQDADLLMAPEPKSAWELERTRSVSASWHRDGRDEARIIYLTFDDGPFPRWTARILRLLERNDARATFFQLGLMRQEYPHLTELVEASGNRIGNHGYAHESMEELTARGIRRELDLGAPSQCFRPPYGSMDEQTERVLGRVDVHTVEWTVDSMDWAGNGAADIARRVVTRAQPGSIILMHDGGGDRSETVAALDQILPALTAQGYEFHALPC